MHRILWTLLAAMVLPHDVNGTAARQPSATTFDVPPPNEERSVILCPDCDIPFDTPTHGALLSNLVDNPYAAELRKALYWQDIINQFRSKAHFDNCDFKASLDYIQALLGEVDELVRVAEQAGTATGAYETALASAFFTLGQAIHGVQDFYAHSNYVELMEARVQRVEEIQLVLTWTAEARERIKTLQREGLVSGYVFWGFPQVCPEGTPTHAELAKDAEDSTAGSVRVAHLRNISRYRIARFLARETSLRFMADAFRRWPLLKATIGDHVLIDLLIDRRRPDTGVAP